MATYYINADSGNNANPGSSASPWQTLAYAITNSASGDTIICQAATATYTFATQSITDRTIKASNYGDATFDGAGATARWTLNNTVVLQNLIIQNAANGGSNGVITFTTNNVGNYTVSKCRLTNLTITGSGDQSIGVFGRFGGSNTLESITISNCQIDNFALPSNGAHVFGFRGASGTVQITNTIAYLSAGANQIIATFINSLTSLNLTFKNNIIYSNTAATRFFFTGLPSGATVDADYNLYYNISYSTVGSTLPIGPNANDLDGIDPLFVDGPNFNFNLRPTSPGIDAGVII